MVPAALGSDTGGSIRQPASLTHTVGLKPSYGRVSRFGLVAFASSLDQVGPIATDTRGASAVFQAISGPDPKDATCSSLAVADTRLACGAPVTGLRIGIPAEYFGEGLDPEVSRCVHEALEALVNAGCELRPVHLPHTRYAIATYYVIATAEASSNLARFDGVRFGMRVTPDRGQLSEMYAMTRGAGFGPEVKRRIMLGTYVLSAGYYEAYYLKAQKLRTLMRRDFSEAFQQVDLIATPTSPVVAWRLGEKLSDPLSMYLADIFTLPASLAGVPAVSVPCKTVSSQGEALPVGLQLIAPAYREDLLFRAASAWEAMNPQACMIPPC
jgi:aspartyl-tRNA(Asn)/glutamyl-tRNA(Gln) amidotransferase subunit A